MKNTVKVNAMMLGSLCLLSACNGVNIEGAWVEPVPGMEEMQQGFVLAPGGKASSINMATLQYESWKEEKGMNYNKNLNIFNNYKYVYAYV